MGLLWTVGLWVAAPLTAVAALGCLLSVEPALAAADLFNALLIAVNLTSLWGLTAPRAKDL